MIRKNMYIIVKTLSRGISMTTSSAGCELNYRFGKRRHNTKITGGKKKAVLTVAFEGLPYKRIWRRRRSALA